MQIIQISAECYPAAKAGGLGDVVGALPKYLRQEGEECSVVMPRYDRPWFNEQSFNTVHEADAPLGTHQFHYRIQREQHDVLGFPLYVIDIPGRLDRPGIYIDPYSGYGYWDEFERFLTFQVAALDWIKSFKDLPDVIHCHDHHAGLVPFMMTNCFRFNRLDPIPTVLTVHNGQYHGTQDMSRYELLPSFNLDNIGLLEWNHKLNSLAAGVKTAWKVTTVSRSYMNELQYESNGLEELFRQERPKSQGIVNGIDVDVWDPETDPFIPHHYGPDQVRNGKKKNKEVLCGEFGLDPELPTISYIGRLAGEKGADLLPDVMKHFLHSKKDVNFVVLGTGNPNLHQVFGQMNSQFTGYFDATLDYNEQLAHQIYAGSDFIIMPSRVEPCGLNQMYAMRYGSVPIVRSVGGLKDTVVDLKENNGYGIRFDAFTLEAAINAVDRGIELFASKRRLNNVRERIMSIDFSWHASAREYISMYKDLK